MAYDIVIIGGSFAGLAAALQVARARRRVLIVDAKRPRNRFSAASHGFLGQDGQSPYAIMEKGKAEVLAYPTATFIESEVSHARTDDDGFIVTLADGSTHQGARLILATGVKDHLPNVLGLKERWGHSVLHCPYCHGYEVSGGQLGVLAVGPLSMHQALLIPDWGPTTFFLNSAFELSDEQRNELQLRGVTLEETPVESLAGENNELTGVQLADGRLIPLEALFTASRTSPASPLAEQLGCDFVEGPLGPYIRVDATQQTTVTGVYAAGDAARAMTNATFAAADGVMAGVAAHRSLIFGK